MKSTQENILSFVLRPTVSRMSFQRPMLLKNQVHLPIKQKVALC